MSQTPPPPPPPGGGPPDENDPDGQPEQRQGPPPDHPQRPDYGERPGYGGNGQPGYDQQRSEHPGRGLPAYYVGQPGEVPVNGTSTSTKSVVSLILGIVSLVPCSCLLLLFPLPVALLPAIPAVIVGILARKETAVTGENGAGIALTGIVLGIVATVLSVLVVALVLVLGAMVVNNLPATAIAARGW